MPKSSSRGSPSAVTRMLDGLTSRWTICRSCACASASHTWTKSESRDSTLEPVADAVLGDRLALDVLHREVRQAVLGDAAVEQARDARVVERREDLPLLAEPADHPGVQVGAAPHQLERDPLVELAVVPVGEEHGAHPALADDPLDPVGPDPLGQRDLASRR